MRTRLPLPSKFMGSYYLRQGRAQPGAKPDAQQAQQVAAQDVRPEAQEGPVLRQRQGLPGIAAEGRVAAQEASDGEQAPQRAEPRPSGGEGQQQANHERAGDVDDEGSVGELGAPSSGR